MDDCIFCKVVRGELPSYKVYEDENFLAFLDINPRAPGHTQIVPKRHYRWVWDVPNIGEYFEVARKIALAQKKAFDTEMILCRVTGEEISHAHVWILPDKTVIGNLKDFEKNAEKIRKEIKLTNQN